MKRRFPKFLEPIARILMRSWVGRFPLVKGAYHSCLRPFLPNFAIFSLEVEDVEMQLKIPKHYPAFLEIYFKGMHEEQVTKKLKNIIQEGMTVVDVGASFGYYIIFIAKLVGEKGKVFAFEPHPFTYNLLQENIELNRLNNVIPVKKAVSSRVETAKMWLASSNIESSNILTRRDTNDYTVVECTSLDEFFKDINPCSVDVLIMDIEGAEVSALQGMSQIMTTNENLKMIIEFHPHRIRAFGHSPRELWVELRQNEFWPPFLISQDGKLIELRDCPDLENIEKEKHPIHLFIERKLER